MPRSYDVLIKNEYHCLVPLSHTGYPAGDVSYCLFQHLSEHFLTLTTLACGLDLFLKAISGQNGDSLCFFVASLHFCYLLSETYPHDLVIISPTNGGGPGTVGLGDRWSTLIQVL